MRKSISPLNLAITTIFTALTCIVTVLFSVYVPATRGFFNVGESMVFLSAILFGPLVGSFAGGVGSMLADLFLGYPYYAPATLIIKACEGYVVGLLTKSKLPKFKSKLSWKLFTLILGITAGFLLTIIGIVYYTGQINLTLGSATFSFQVPSSFWVILGTLVTLTIAVLGLIVDPEFGWTIFSVLAGGFIMVIGYFIYQMFLIGPIFNIQVIAIAEIPINLGQMIIGALIALPLSKIVLRVVPYLK